MARTNSSIQIRAANRRDIPAIVEIANSSVDEDEEVGFGTVRSESLFTDVSRLSAAWREPNHVRAEEVLVAELQGRVVGCVTVEDRGEVVELINIDVARERQGRGIGTRMVRLVEERARSEGKRAVTLGTSRNAAGVAWRSLPWWLSRGYHITGEEENEWTRSIGPGTREIRMEKTIPRRIEVSLRDVAETDLPIFFDFQRDSAANYMAAFTARDPTDKEAFAAHWNRILNDDTVLVKTIIFDGQVVGSVAKFVDKEFGKPEVTYWIGKEYWGMGLATKALARFLREVTVRPIYGRAAKDNVASIRVLEKCGFTMSGQGKGFANARGKVVEEVILELADTPARRPWRTRTLRGHRGRPVLRPESQLFGTPEEQGHPQGEGHESRREPDEGDPVVLCRSPEDRQAGAQRAGSEGDEAGEASLSNSDPEQNPVQREPKRDGCAHVHGLKDPMKVGRVHESEEKAQ